MRLEFKDYTDFSELTKHTGEVKPLYGKGTMKGVVWCPYPCNRAVGDLIGFPQIGKFVGWFRITCPECGKAIDYSAADKFI